MVDEEVASGMANLQMADEEVLEVRTVKLKSCDDHIFEVDAAVACESPILSFVIEDLGTENFIPVINVSGHTLALVIQYCRYHVENDNSTPPHVINAWDAEFVNVSVATLCSLTLAADYLNLENLSILVSKAITEMCIRGKKLAEIWVAFNLSN